MKEYELSILFHPDLEMNLDPALDKIRKIIESNGGEIIKEESESKKKMAFSIKGQDFAVYYFFNVNLPAAGPNKISSVLNITDEVLRYMLVKEDVLKAKMAARREARHPEDEEEGEKVAAAATEEEAKEGDK